MSDDNNKKIKKDEEAKSSSEVENQEEDREQKEVKDDYGVKLAECENRYLRAVADYRNLENRINEQKGEWIRSANRELLLRFLPILDTLLLARQHSSDKSISIAVSQFEELLRVDGVTKITSLGKEFDPGIMEAITTGEGEDNKVIEELRVGYKLHDKVLRPAQVRVGSKK